MPFASKRQQRAMFGGHIPGMTKEDAHEWAHETPSIKKLPERAPAEKGEPTLRSKKSALEAVISTLTEEGPLVEAFKLATLGTAVVNPNNVGKLRGMMTTHAMKAPGYAAVNQATKPWMSTISAMNKLKPH